MKRSIIVCCTLACFGVGIACASVPPQSPEEATARAAAAAERDAMALGEAQDHAVANYQRNVSRMAAAAERAQAKAAAVEAIDKRNKSHLAAAAKTAQAKAVADETTAAQKAKKKAEALAKAQDRVVAYYKGTLGKDSETVVAKAVRGAARGTENLTCFTGNKDRHARIGVQLVNGKVNYVAFYSKRKPRTCSIDMERNGHGSRWADNGTTSKVTFAGNHGVMLIQRKEGGIRFVFQNVDREQFCGMDGKINGSLTVMRGKSQCIVQGIMDGHAG